MMAAKYGNYPLIKYMYYFENVDNPIEVNTKTKQSLSEIVDDETYRIISLLKNHLSKNLSIVSDDHCGICLEGWKAELADSEDGPKQGVLCCCAEKRHRLCSTQRKEPEDVLNSLVPNKDMEGYRIFP